MKIENNWEQKLEGFLVEHNDEIKVLKRREQRRKYRAIHREEINKRKREYYHKNIEMLHIKQKDYYYKNKPRILAYNRNYYNKNKDRFRAYQNSYRAERLLKYREYNREYMRKYREKLANEYGGEYRELYLINLVNNRYNAYVLTYEEAIEVKNYYRDVRLLENKIRTVFSDIKAHKYGIGKFETVFDEVCYLYETVNNNYAMLKEIGLI